MLGLKADGVRGLLAAGYLKGQKVGRVWQILEESVEAFQAGFCENPADIRRLTPQTEYSLAAGNRCPVCGGPFQGVSGHGSSWSSEFLECRLCEFSIHESFVGGHPSEELQRGIREHLARLSQRVKEGRKAEVALRLRRQI